jgi:hypothetical protein
MTSISYFARLPGETNAGRLCRKKASDCRRAALTAEDPRARRVYLQLAKLWREMANMREAGEPSNEGGVVIDFFSRTRV